MVYPTRVRIVIEIIATVVYNCLADVIEKCGEKFVARLDSSPRICPRMGDSRASVKPVFGGIHSSMSASSSPILRRFV